MIYLKKGFTLVELISVIIVLGIISLIVFPVVRNQIELVKTESYNRSVDSIVDAARRYVSTGQLGYPTEEQTLSLEVLIQAGLLDRNALINPRTDDPLGGCVMYKWNETSNIFEYRYEQNC